MYDDLERLCRSIRSIGFWREGWIGVKETLRFDGAGMEAEVKARLEGLEKLLRPIDLVQKVRSMILVRGGSRYVVEDVDIDDGKNPAVRQREEPAVALGRETAKHPATFGELLPDLTKGDGLQRNFGIGLALGTDDPEEMWKALTAQFRATKESERNWLVLSGFLEGLNTRDPALVDRLLDEALADAVLAENFPSLQCSVAIDRHGIVRLIQALDKAPPWQFKVLAAGRASEPIPGADLRALLSGIAAKPEGLSVAMEILVMRIFADRDKPEGIDREVIAAGRDLLRLVDFPGLERNPDHHVGSLIARCLQGAEGLSTAQNLCRRFMQTIVANRVYAYGHDWLIGNLFKVQPMSMLDCLFGGTTNEVKIGQKIIEQVVHGDQPNPLDNVSQAEILAWCERDRTQRYLVMASVVTLFRRAASESVTWSELAQALLDQAPDRLAIVKTYARRFRPRSFSGSLAAAMELALAPLRTPANLTAPISG
jgi:hypothetical protein